MNGTEPCSCKIGRAVRKYDLDRVDEELIRRHADGTSLRDLAEYLNRRILAAALDVDAGLPADDSESGFGALGREDILEAVYRTLGDDEVPADRAARVRTRLDQAGVDVNEVEDDWVTHPTVRGHLRECLDIDTSREPSLTAEDGLDTIQWAIARCVGVIEQSISRLRSADRVSITSPDVDVQVRISCLECGSSYATGALIERGHCDCDTG